MAHMPTIIFQLDDPIESSPYKRSSNLKGMKFKLEEQKEHQ